MMPLPAWLIALAAKVWRPIAIAGAILAALFLAKRQGRQEQRMETRIETLEADKRSLETRAQVNQDAAALSDDELRRRLLERFGSKQ